MFYCSALRVSFRLNRIPMYGLRPLSVVRHSQGMGNDECYKRLANALGTLQMLPNGLPKIDGDWQYSQHSLKFRRRFLNWPIFVSRWRMTCERSEFVTNANKYSASVANFERMSNLFIRKHIHKHIRTICGSSITVRGEITSTSSDIASKWSSTFNWDGLEWSLTASVALICYKSPEEGQQCH